MECPCCAYSAELADRAATRFGGKKFGANMVSITAVVTGLRAVDITGKARGEEFSRARVALLIAMRTLGAKWEECGKTLNRERGSVFRIHAEWNHKTGVRSESSKILAAYEGQS